ncbi:MAG: SPOR domain-containing protein [Myxococcota bacterium]
MRSRCARATSASASDRPRSPWRRRHPRAPRSPRHRRAGLRLGDPGGRLLDEAVARKLVDGLRGKGFPTELVPAEGRKERWRVRVQPVAGEREARAMAERLKRDERLPTWVLPLEARSGS